MKTRNLIIIGLTFFLFSNVNAQEYPPVNKSSLDASYYPKKAVKRNFSKTDEEKIALMPKMRVLYSRPTMKGRKIFGNLIKYGEVWRLGANEATEVQFFVDVMIAGKTIKAGRYTVYAIPDKSEWVMVINNDTDVWGAYSYNEKKDVCRVTVPVESTKKEIEALSATFHKVNDNEVKLYFSWDHTQVGIPIKIMK